MSVKLTATNMEYLASRIDSPLVNPREGGGYVVTDFPLTTSSPNASMHVDSDGNVVTAHNEHEVVRIMGQLATS